MPVPTIADVLSRLPPEPPATLQGRENRPQINTQWVLWVQAFADLQTAKAAGVVANAHLAARGEKEVF